MDTLKKLREDCLCCTHCELEQTRQNVVFGVGNEASEILFLGEGPGKNEDELGEPFVGRSGKLLDYYLASIGLHRQKNIYITNIVKCRPPNNRDPLPAEQKSCFPWLQMQFQIMKPKIVVCLGRVAAKVMIQKDFSVMKQHGEWFYKDGIWYMGTLHPAALLRCPKNKPFALADYAALRNKINEVCNHTELLPPEP